ncbi:MAG: hypothetical protein MUF69_07190 [Desulfobacterota bacterium]|jgi:hypothetical protein|nr:hypothetical protein [Thermodesulfobacteriota bacterium]
MLKSGGSEILFRKKLLWSLMILAIVSAPGMVGAFQVAPEFKRLMECQQRPTIEEPAENQTFLTGVPALLPVGAAVSCQVSDYSKYFFEIQTEYYHQEPGKAPVWKVFHTGSRIPFHPQGDLTVSFRAFKQLEFIYYGQWRLRARAGYLTANGTAIRGPYGNWRYFKINDPSDLPDLVVDGMEVLQVPAGQQTVDGQSYPETMTYVVFTIRNKGKKIAPPTRVEVFCHSYMANDPCPQFPQTNIPQLWPKPNDLSGAYKIWNSPAAFIREDSLLGFRVTVDPDKQIQESNEENNERVYTMEQARNRAGIKKAFHPEALKKTVQTPTASLEAGMPVSRGAGESPKLGQTRPAGPGANAAMKVGPPAASSLVIQGLLLSPLKPTAGVPFELSAQGLNEGQDPIPPGQALHLTCRVIQGGPNCPVPTGPITLRGAIPAKGLQRLPLGTFTAHPGVYEITLGSEPQTGKQLKTLTLTVEAPPVQQKVPAIGTPQAAPLTGSQPAGTGQPSSLSPTPHRPLKR